MTPTAREAPSESDDASSVVELRLTDSALDRIVAQIRMWLVQQAYQPKTFRYQFDEQEVVLRVDFAGGPGAEAFVETFGGKLLS